MFLIISWQLLNLLTVCRDIIRQKIVLWSSNQIYMSKAYDRIDLSFLEAIMRNLGFNEKWIALMMLCVSTISYSIFVNGEPKGLINPTRSIRQGNLLSPFLSLLCAKGLHGHITTRLPSLLKYNGQLQFPARKHSQKHPTFINIQININIQTTSYIHQALLLDSKYSNKHSILTHL